MLCLLKKYIFPLLALVLFVAGCGGGGGGGGTSLAGGGIGGTGITSGAITGFGSVFVNGIEFETDGSSFDVDDDMAANQDNLGIGMVVTVIGSVNPDGVTGSALSILYDDEVEGPIAADPIEDADRVSKTFTVLGISVVVDRNTTVFSGTDYDSLAMGDIVEVSGFFDGTGALMATRLEKVDELILGTSEVEMRGTVSDFNGTDSFLLDDITVMLKFDDPITDLSEVPGGVIEDGQFVEVKGTLETPTFITALRIELENEGFDDDEEMASIQGFVTDFSGIGSFKVDGQWVDASAAEFKPASLATSLDNNASVEVSGSIVSGVLQAIEVEQRGGEIKVIAPVTTFDVLAGSVNVSVVSGQPDITVQTDSQTQFEDERDGMDDCSLSSLSTLMPGEGLIVEGFISGGSGVLASSIKCDILEKIELRGPLDAASGDDTSGTVTILGVTIDTDMDTKFEDGDDAPTSGTSFFGAVSPGDPAEIQDDLPADGIADKVEIE
jgi:hypothetical protein